MTIPSKFKSNGRNASRTVTDCIGLKNSQDSVGLGFHFIRRSGEQMGVHCWPWYFPMCKGEHISSSRLSVEKKNSIEVSRNLRQLRRRRRRYSCLVLTLLAKRHLFGRWKLRFLSELESFNDSAWKLTFS